MPLTVSIDWRRGPRELRHTLDAVRGRFLDEVEEEARRNAPTKSVADSIRRTASRVTVDHPAAPYLEFGAKPHFPPLEPIAAWAISVGKLASEAFPIARAIAERGFEPRPFFVPAVKRAASRLHPWFRELWRGSGSGL